jgi:hypothetical protein
MSIDLEDIKTVLGPRDIATTARREPRHPIVVFRSANERDGGDILGNMDERDED